MEELRTIEIFQKRKKEFLKRSNFSISLFLFGFFAAIFSFDVFKNHIAALFFVLFMIIGVLLFVFVSCKNYRCPKCNKIPMFSNLVWKYGVAINPINCPNCGVVLDNINQKKVDNSERIWAFVALLIGLVLYFGSLYMGNLSHRAFVNGERVYGEVVKVYSDSYKNRYEIKWIDSQTGQVVSKETRKQDVYMFSANEGYTGEFILYNNKIFAASWTEFFLFPVIMFLVSMWFIISVLDGLGIKVKKDE